MRSLDIIGYDDYCVTPFGRVFSLKSRRFLSPSDNHGYLRVTLRKCGTPKTLRVHRLMAYAYFGLPESEDSVVNHKDGDRSNNVISNLEWCTQSYNVKHAHNTGLVKETRRLSQRSLDDDLVHKVCDLIQDSFRNKDIAEMLNVNQTRIADIRSGACYPDISKEYNFKKANPPTGHISPEKLIRICEMIQAKESYAKIKAAVNCSSKTIASIKKRKTGTYISNNYSW